MKSENINFAQYTQKSIPDILTEFQTTIDKGLTKSQVLERQKKYGLNEIKSREAGWSAILLRQLKSPFIYLLAIIAIVSFFLQSRLEAGVILAVMLLNTLFGFFQEYRAAQTLGVLKQLIVSTVTVIRNGFDVQVPSNQIVPGDIVMLHPGDVIPADIRFLSDQNITVDESMLTGESEAVLKQSASLNAAAQETFKASNIGFWGTHVLSGKAVGVVIGTGLNTSLGNISALTVETVRISTFEKNMRVFSSFILKLMVISLVVIFCAHLFINGNKMSIIELILFSCALAVSVIPEALPIITTFALSQGALRLARKKAVVKRLSAIEDLGNIEILCTDKTGTLTENVSKVENILGDNERSIVFDAALINCIQVRKHVLVKGFDLAVYNYLNDSEKEELKKYKKIAEIPFDPMRRRDLNLVAKDNNYVLVVRGSPQDVLVHCQDITPEKMNTIHEWIAQEGKLGRRVLAVAKKEMQGPIDSGIDLAKLEEGVEFIGIIAFGDPLKKSAKDAIAKARTLNVEVKVLSGDTVEVCASVAIEVGLIKDVDEVISGEIFALKSDDEKEVLVKTKSVFARVSPQQKYEIIYLLQKEKEVGYLGDGINDAPALKIANVGMAVQDAANIAREAADIILLRRSLLVIVDGIEEGRRAFANTLKYVRSTLSTSFGNFYSVGLISLFIDYLPMLPVQLLLINVLPDLPMLAIATDRIDESELLRPAKYNVRSFIILATMLGLIASTFDFIYFSNFSKMSVPVIQTGWFVESILTALVFIFSIRTSKLFFNGARPSFSLLFLALLVGGIAIGLPYTTFGQTFFSLVPLKKEYMLKIMYVVISYFFITELVKVIYYRMFNSN
jgi:Mg2+-importing ATPase